MKWTTLRHNGVAFPPEYEYRGLTVRIKGEPVKLEPLQEEMLMAWAKKKDTPYVQDTKFQENFLGDLIPVLPERFRDITLRDIDWSEMNAIVDREKTANLSPEEKKKRSAERKAQREELKAKFGTATIDEDETEIGAYLVEPPGILMGRGEHPLRGKWKRRVMPEDVTLNLDEEAPVPAAPEGHHWGNVVHRHDAMWVASWNDELSNKTKYVWLAETSDLRQERDREKYVKAAKLESNVDKIRAEIRKRMNYTDKHTKTLAAQENQLRIQIKALEDRLLKASGAKNKDLEDQIANKRAELEQVSKRFDRARASEMKTRQLATVCYLIDRLAMRVGDEKDEDEADTVGASTLRCEHIQVHSDRVEFDFLGKDSVRWQKTLELSDEEKVLARNLQDFMQGKEPVEQVFDKIDSTHVNQFLSSIVKGLTAKVFRTFHATTTVRNALRDNGNLKSDVPTFEKEYTAKLANLQAAITCNHKRTPPKNWEESLAKKKEAVDKLREAKPDLAKLEAEIPKREAALKRLLEEEKQLEPKGRRVIEQKVKAMEKLRALKRPDDPKLAKKHDRACAAAEKAVDQAEADLKKKKEKIPERIAKAREAVEHAKQAPARAEREYHERIARAERTADLAERTRDYNLGTSLKNYIDPRVYKAWGDYVDFDWKRLYTKALQRKFAWAEREKVHWNAASTQEMTAESNEEIEEEIAEGPAE